MNGHFPLLLCLFISSSIFGQEVPSLRSLALDRATKELHTQLIKPQSLKDRLSLIKKWEVKSGLVTPKENVSQETILDRFEQKYFSKLEKFKQVPYGKIYAITSDNTRAIINKTYTDDDKSGLSLWDLCNNKRIRTLNPPHTKIINHVALTTDETKAISASADHTVILWDLITGTPIHTFKGHVDSVVRFSLTSDNEKAVSASEDGRLILWDIKTGKSNRIFEGHTDAVTHVVITKDNNRALSASRDDTLILWNLNTGKSIFTLSGHDSMVQHVALTKDNTKAVSASLDNTLILWNLNTGKPIHSLKGHTCGVNKVYLTYDNTKALSASMDKTLKLWDLNTGNPILTLRGHTNGVEDCLLIADDTKAISTDGQTIILWDLKTGNILQQIELKCCYELFKHQNMIAAKNKLFRIEDWSSIIMRMPQSYKQTITTPTNLLDIKQAGSLAGLYKAHLQKKK